jgi:hypothetical protein
MKHAVILLALFASLGALAQPSGERIERLKQLKVAYLSEALNLTVEEGQQFWPLYNAYEAKREASFQQRRVLWTQLSKSAEHSSEKSLFDALAAERSLQEELHRETEAYARKVLPILGVSRTAKLLSAEEEFRERLMRELRDRGEGAQRRR